MKSYKVVYGVFCGRYASAICRGNTARFRRDFIGGNRRPPFRGVSDDASLIFLFKNHISKNDKIVCISAISVGIGRRL